MNKSSDWIAAMKKAGHNPVMENGHLDIFVMDEGRHNGPGCQTCGASWCWHCDDTSAIHRCASQLLPSKGDGGMSGNHTPTPWTQYQLGATIYGADGFYVGITQSKYPEADAALIVTAVNSYASSQAEIERLRAALTTFVTHYPMGINPFLDDAYRDARTALSGSKE